MLPSLISPVRIRVESAPVPRGDSVARANAESVLRLPVASLADATCLSGAIPRALRITSLILHKHEFDRIDREVLHAIRQSGALHWVAETAFHRMRATSYIHFDPVCGASEPEPKSRLV